MLPTWFHLEPFGARRDTCVLRVAEYLASDEARAAVARQERTQEYPQEILEGLRERDIDRFLAPTPDASRVTHPHLTGLGALLASGGGGAVAISVCVNALALLPLYLRGTEAQRRWVSEKIRGGERASFLLSELAAGSDLAACTTRARPVSLERGALEPGELGEATHFRIDGEKQFINGGRRHALRVVLARTGSDAAPGTAGGWGDFSLFLLDSREGIEPLDGWQIATCRGADISGVRFCGALASRDEVVGRVGDGLRISQDTLTISRGAISGLASGTVSRARAQAAGYASARVVFGSAIERFVPIEEHLLALRAYDLLTAALSVKQSALVNAWGVRAAYYTAVAKFAASRMGEEAVTHARRLLGARALVEEEGLSAVWRDAALYGVFDGSQHLMLDQIQWRLGQRAAACGDARQRLADAYGRAPRALLDEPPKGRALVLSPQEILAALAPHDPSGAAGSLYELARHFEALRREAHESGRWEADAAFRFALAEWAARFEAAVALVELGLPECRAALGLDDARVDAREVRHALFFGAERSALELALLRAGGDARAETRPAPWGLGAEVLEIAARAGRERRRLTALEPSPEPSAGAGRTSQRNMQQVRRVS